MCLNTQNNVSFYKSSNVLLFTVFEQLTEYELSTKIMIVNFCVQVISYWRLNDLEYRKKRKCFKCWYLNKQKNDYYNGVFNNFEYRKIRRSFTR